MIYLDNSATTQTRVEVAKLVAEYSINNYFNPSSVYVPAINVKLDIDNARKRIMALLGVTSGKVIFTGSATEANNLVLNGLARKNKKIVITQKRINEIIFNTFTLTSNAFFFLVLTSSIFAPHF